MPGVLEGQLLGIGGVARLVTEPQSAMLTRMILSMHLGLSPEGDIAAVSTIIERAQASE